jgi:ketosteroid isomerase-like protein
MHARSAFAVVVLSLAAAACAPAPAPPPPVDVAAVRKFIEGENAKFIEALKKGDSTAASMNYAEDAIFMQPDEPALRGRAAIMKNLGAGIVARTIVYEKPTTEDVIVRDDIAVETGTFEFTMKPKGAAAAKEFSGRGKYLTIWKKQADGGWKIIRDINNSDTPTGK